MFVQVIEGRTSDAAGVARQIERWQSEVRPGAIGHLGLTHGVTDDGRAISIVRFASPEDAAANSDRPEQGNWWAETEKYYDGEVTFTNSTDVQEFLGGGSDDAGFVQVMKSAGVDRAVVARTDQAFESVAGQRSDLLGIVRIWTSEDRCISVAYFTDEAGARAGEQSEMPAQLQELMAEFHQAMGETQYLDLNQPVLR